MDLTQPFQLISFLITILTLSMQLFVIYIILYISPKNMSDYRRYLIITTIFEFCYIFDYGILMMPEPPEFYPGMGLWVRGIAGYFGETPVNLVGVGTYFFGTAMICSHDICLTYRYFAVCPNKEFCKKFTSTKYTVILYSIVLLISLSISIGLYMAIAPPSEYKKIIDSWTMTSLGRTIDIDLKTPRLLLYNNQPYLKQFFNVVGGCLIASEFIYFGLVFLILRILHTHSTKFSRRSLKLHRQLTLLLAIQIVVPLLMLVIPYLNLLILMDQKKMNDRFGSQVVSLIFSCHSFMMSMMTIILITPYRKFITKQIRHLIHPSEMFTKVEGKTQTTGLSSITG